MATATARKTATPADAPVADKPVESKAAEASRVAPLDLSALTVEDAPAPKRSGVAGSGRKAADNSVAEGWLRDSWNGRGEGEKVGKGKALTVPSEAIGTLKSRLNRAAQTLELGVTFVVETVDDSRSKLIFAAKVRRNAPKRSTK